MEPIGSKQIRIKPAYLISGGASGRNFYKNFNYNFVKILIIYFFSTIFVIFLYRLSDIRLLDSANLAFTTISAGGFIPADNLSSIVKNNFQTFVVSISLLFPIFNFFLIQDVIARQFSLKKLSRRSTFIFINHIIGLSFLFFCNSRGGI